ncbi:MAG: hypothetical protein J6M53_00080 [Bacteroidaceae bacterium]|nr:hypothetical protein [Bacteroidaceae bacterium]
MKTTKRLFLLLVCAALTLGVTGCSDAEDGESTSTWFVRNMLGGGWTLGGVKVDGTYEWGTTFHMEMNLHADGRKFEAHRFFYMPYTTEDGRESTKKDDATDVVKRGTFEIKDNNKTIVATDTETGEVFFKLELTDEVSSTLTGTITFYDINETYEVYFNRAAGIKI